MNETYYSPIILGDDTFVIEPLLDEESFLLQPRILPLVAELTSLFAARAEAESIEGLLAVAGPVVTASSCSSTAST